jgi:membrane associated rhomboid family serine protease
VFVRVAYIPAALLIGVWFLTQFLSLGELAKLPRQSGGVAYAAHVGGFIFGAATARLFENRQGAD